MDNKEYMKEAVKEANKNALNNFKDGGPFGAVIVKDGKIIARGHNTVLSSKDPTAHAEINAIRMATQKLGTHDLQDCVLFTNAEPCPMCLSAIIWANIKEIYYANTRKDAEEIGFRDNMIYEVLANNCDKNVITIKQITDTDAIKTFEEFKNNSEKALY